jgi:ferredoxin-NADP reductase
MIEDQANAPPGIRWQSARIVAIVERTKRIKSFFLSLPEPFTYLAGQHVDLRLTAADGYSAMRSYSIASAPSGSNVIELAIERLENGEVSPFFHEVAAVGDDIELRGPLGGYFIWSAADGGPLLMVGGGSGVVPLMAMVRDRQATAGDVPALLLLSARTWDDALYRDELFELERLSPAFTLVLTLSRGEARRPGDYARRVDAAMMGEIKARLPGEPKFVFICGSNAFVNSAADGAVAGGVPGAIIRTERYGG